MTCSELNGKQIFHWWPFVYFLLLYARTVCVTLCLWLRVRMRIWGYEEWQWTLSDGLMSSISSLMSPGWPSKLGTILNNNCWEFKAEHEQAHSCENWQFSTWGYNNTMMNAMMIKLSRGYLSSSPSDINSQELSWQNHPIIWLSQLGSALKTPINALNTEGII